MEYKLYSHLLRKRTRVIQIEVGNGASHVRISAMLKAVQPVQHQPGDQNNTWISRQRERVGPPVPAEKTEGGGHGLAALASPPAAQAVTAGDPSHESPYRLSHDRLWAQVVEMAGARLSPLLISGRLRPVAGRMRLARVCPRPSTDGSHPAGRFRNAGARCLPRGHRAAPQARRQEDVSASPDSRPSAHLGTPAGGRRRRVPSHWKADSVIGGCNLHTEWRGGLGFLGAHRSRPDAGERQGRSWT